MSLDARTVAIQGIGKGARLTAVQGFASVEIHILPSVIGGASNHKHKGLIHVHQISALLALSTDFKVGVSYTYSTSPTPPFFHPIKSQSFDPNKEQREEEDNLLLLAIHKILSAP